MRRRIIQESQRDGRCPMARTEREDGRVGREFLVGRRFGSGWGREADLEGPFSRRHRPCQLVVRFGRTLSGHTVFPASSARPPKGQPPFLTGLSSASVSDSLKRVLMMECFSAPAVYLI